MVRNLQETAPVTLNLMRVHSDDGGDTRLSSIPLPEEDGPDDGAGKRLTLRDIPTTTLSIGQLLGRRPAGDFHPAPRRQLVVVLRGAFEITTTRGQRKRFGPGDCLLAEDVGGKGHLFEDVGDEPLATLRIGVAPDWECPSA
jgi:hypothetical protein